MADSPGKILLPFSNAAPLIEDADLLLWRPTSLRGWVQAQLSRSEFSHASKAHWIETPRGKRLMTLGTEERRGGVPDDLRDHVDRYPGVIDVYRANPGNRWPEYDRLGSIRWTIEHGLGRRYGWWATIRAALSRVIVLRWFSWFNPSRYDEENGTKPPNCSALCSMSDRIGGGVDPVPRLSDLSTEPGDLATSKFYEYRFTLIADDWEGKP